MSQSAQSVWSVTRSPDLDPHPNAKPSPDPNQVRDADACLKLAPRFAKAHFAQGRALYFLSDYEAAFVQYDAGLRLEHHPRIAAWLEAERHKPEYATHAGPRALVRRLAAAVRANDVRRLELVLGRCPAQVRTSGGSSPPSPLRSVRATRRALSTLAALLSLLLLPCSAHAPPPPARSSRA